MVELAPGETKTVSFKIDIDHLYFIDKNLKKYWNPFVFKVFIGSNSVDLKEAKFEL